MKKHTLIFLFVVGIVLTNPLFGQSGGKKREKKAKPRGNFVLSSPKSHGNADKFARGSSGRRGKLARLFTKEKSAWTYKRSGSVRSQNKANKYLFKRERSEGLVENANTQKRNNKKRAKRRDRGNESFSKKKH